MKYFVLSNGVSIPAVGMGTGWLNTAYRSRRYLIKRRLKELIQRIKGEYSNENTYTVSYELNKIRNFKQSVLDAKQLGFELYDTAYSYNNCETMGSALGFPDKRENTFIISKCSNRNQRMNTVSEELEKTLKAFHTDYIDLYLIHWPQTDKYVDTWKQFEEFYAAGKVKAIGVSNFHIHHLEEIRSKCSIMPMVDELECHPLLQQWELRQYCKENNIQLIAHTSTGKMRSNIRESVLKDIALAHDKSIAQIILRWHYQLGDVSICNTLNPQHMRENQDIFDFVLSNNEMEMISQMDCGTRIWPDPDNCDFTKLA